MSFVPANDANDDHQAVVVVPLDEALCPRPRNLSQSNDGAVTLSLQELRVVCEPDNQPLANAIARSFQSANLGNPAVASGGAAAETKGALTFRLVAEQEGAVPAPCVHHSTWGDERYALEVQEGGCVVSAATPAGLFRGAQTLVQVLAWHKRQAKDPGGLEKDGGEVVVPWLTIRDGPSLGHRAYMLDVSRTRVPTMASLKELIEDLARFKYNELQLYIEHTFAYSAHEVVWRGYSPLTAADIREIDEFCKSRFVELVPNQNCLGHFHRWLRHDQYRPLAECPEGLWHPFSDEKEPFSLSVADPKVMELLAGMFDEYLPNFSCKRLNVNLDEAFDLGRSRSKEEARRLGGKGGLFLKHLNNLRECLTARDVQLMCWGDALSKNPHILPQVPKDVTVMEWGYEASHKFDKSCARLAKHGLGFYVCPGTSSWTSIAGRTQNMVENVQQAVLAAVRHGGKGLMTTDWGDGGHLQPAFVSYPGLLTAAALSWNAGEASPPQHATPFGDLYVQSRLAMQLGWLVFRDSSNTLGRVACDMGNIYREVGVKPENSSLLFWGFQLPDSMLDNHLIRAAGDMFLGFDLTRLTRVAGWVGGRAITRVLGIPRSSMLSAKAHVQALRKRVPPAAALGVANSELVLREVHSVLDLLEWACDVWVERIAVGVQKGLDKVNRERAAALADRLEAIIATHRALWAERSREGGLDESCKTLQKALALLRA